MTDEPRRRHSSPNGVLPSPRGDSAAKRAAVEEEISHIAAQLSGLATKRQRFSPWQLAHDERRLLATVGEARSW